MQLMKHTFDAPKIEGQALHLNTSYAQFGETSLDFTGSNRNQRKLQLKAGRFYMHRLYGIKQLDTLTTKYFILRFYYTHEKFIPLHITVL